ncbi:MAG: diacylglycerol kinase family protein [Myxococcota bacterium]|nr:diacylglycerol kinase family protein [Myxococcota bacterium]
MSVAMAGIGVITNPRSRRNRKDPRLAQQLAYVMGEQGQLYAPGDLDALDQVAQHFLDREIDVLAINGGDGTVHVVLSAFVRVYGERPLPRVAILRGGTMNTVASGIGIRGRPEGLLGRLVHQYHSGRPLAVVERNLIRVGDHVGFLFGNGLVTNFLSVYYEGSEPTPWKAFGMVMRSVFSAFVNGAYIRRMIAPIRVEVEVDGQQWPHVRYLAMVAGTVNSIGFQVRPFTRVVHHPNHLEIMGLACSILRLVLLLPRVRLALPVADDEVEVELARKVVMRSERPIPYTLDGDFFPGSEELVLEVGPRIELVLS